MPRTIITKGDRLRLDDKQVDNYIQRLFKYIPSEIVALYVSIVPFLKNATQATEYSIAGLLTIATYLYLLLIQKVKNQSQLLLSSFCFVAWVFALGGPFKYYEWYTKNPFLPLLVLGILTLFIPAIPPNKSEQGTT